MRILVTGGAGFLGSHLIDRLMEVGHEVICLDNFYTGNKQNILHWLDNPYFELIRHDITEPIRLEVDQIYHLACPASPVHYQYNPVKTIKTNVIGTLNMLGLAKRVKARFFLASTSEVYGDPTVHPQSEDYRGNVNCIGIRSCYDEGKRVAETLTYDYHRQNGVDVRVVRIFNSLTGDQNVLYYRGNQLYYEPFAQCYERIKDDFSEVSVPCFDAQSKMVIKPISGVWKHPVRKTGYKIKTTWGKQVKITEDHSLFTRDNHGSPQAVFGRDLQVGDEVAVPRQMTFLEQPLTAVRLTDYLTEEEGIFVSSDSLTAVRSDRTLNLLEQYNLEIRQFLTTEGVNPQGFYTHLKTYEAENQLPLKLWRELGVEFTGKESLVYPPNAVSLPNTLPSIEEFLWVLGFTLAKGEIVETPTGRQLRFTAEEDSLQQLVQTIDHLFGIPTKIEYNETEGQWVQLWVKLIVDLILNRLELDPTKAESEQDIPNWILQLPKAQLVHFLQGFSTHSHSGNLGEFKHNLDSLTWFSSSQKVIEKLCLILTKFGLVGGVEADSTKTDSTKTEKCQPIYSLKVDGLSQTSLLELDQMTQTLPTATQADIAWAKVTEIEAFSLEEEVYDFSVPDHENFVGGSYGICCHNTYGPRMLPNDGRVVSNLIVQALQGIPLTVYGDGMQTRSFCYVSDLVEGFIRLMNSDRTEPVNIGNPGEYTILELAQTIQSMVNPDTELIFKPLPQDDPQQRQPDITRAQQWLDWQPTIPLQQGLEKTIAYFRDRLERENFVPNPKKT